MGVSYTVGRRGVAGEGSASHAECSANVVWEVDEAKRLGLGLEVDADAGKKPAEVQAHSGADQGPPTSRG